MEQAQATVSVVIPVYRGEHTLPALLQELAAVREGAAHVIAEVVLVHDGAVDGSAKVMQDLAQLHPFVRTVWLSRNYGQHPATLAGMAASTGTWIVTMDEDGQQNPADIAAMVGMAEREGAQLVYADPINPPPHGLVRNAASALTKWILRRVLGNATVGRFNSFRCIDGEIGRSIAAYCGNNVFMDVALSWVTGSVAYCPVRLRGENGKRSGYSLRSLLSHFWRLVMTSGTRPLRLITLMGVASLCMGVLLSGYAVWVKVTHNVPVQGWTSLVIVVSVFSGSILFALGIIAEYLAVALGITMGKPLYLAVSKPVRTARKP